MAEEAVRELCWRLRRALQQGQSLLYDRDYVGKPFTQGKCEVLEKFVSVQIAKHSELPYL